MQWIAFNVHHSNSIWLETNIMIPFKCISEKVSNFFLRQAFNWIKVNWLNLNEGIPMHLILNGKMWWMLKVCIGICYIAHSAVINASSLITMLSSHYNGKDFELSSNQLFVFDWKSHLKLIDPKRIQCEKPSFYTWLGRNLSQCHRTLLHQQLDSNLVKSVFRCIKSSYANSSGMREAAQPPLCYSPRNLPDFSLCLSDIGVNNCFVFLWRFILFDMLNCQLLRIFENKEALFCCCIASPI